MTTCTLEYEDGSKEVVSVTYEEWKVIWTSGQWKGKTIICLIKDNWPIVFKQKETIVIHPIK